ncbi:hypothetical protein J4457_04515 [Candidatus Woesearchaeota archaeon]|nr:hypothetical protein [Candidatus Woesearchaeota archaeon]
MISHRYSIRKKIPAGGRRKENKALTHVAHVAVENNPGIRPDIPAIVPVPTSLIFNECWVFQTKICIARRRPIRRDNKKIRNKVHKGVIEIKKSKVLLGVSQIGV